MPCVRDEIFNWIRDGSTENAALDLLAVVGQGVVQVCGGGLGSGFRVGVADGLVDGVVFLDRFRRMATDRAVQPDRAGLVLEPADVPDRRDEQRVVGGRGDAEVELVVAPVEEIVLPGQVALVGLVVAGLFVARSGFFDAE